jgi:hypothetical protein
LHLHYSQLFKSFSFQRGVSIPLAGFKDTQKWTN